MIRTKDPCLQLGRRIGEALDLVINLTAVSLFDRLALTDFARTWDCTQQPLHAVTSSCQSLEFPELQRAKVNECPATFSHQPKSDIQKQPSAFPTSRASLKPNFRTPYLKAHGPTRRNSSIIACEMTAHVPPFHLLPAIGIRSTAIALG